VARGGAPLWSDAAVKFRSRALAIDARLGEAGRCPLTLAGKAGVVWWDLVTKRGAASIRVAQGTLLGDDEDAAAVLTCVVAGRACCRNPDRLAGAWMTDVLAGLAIGIVVERCLWPLSAGAGRPGRQRAS
jgi:hypothetical protein